MKITNTFLRLLLLAGVLILGPYSLHAAGVDAAKGDALLKQMSTKLASARTFSFKTTETQSIIRMSGKRATLHFSRQVLIQRPDRLWFRFEGDRSANLWYDGNYVTIVSTKEKVFAQKRVRKTIDETLDYLAERLNMNMPMSDLFYSSPYDSFMSASGKGGFIGTDKIDGASCNHLAYQTEDVKWELWINETDSLPCQLSITFVDDLKGNEDSMMKFTDWNLSAEVPDGAFAYKIPEGYERIPILERPVLKEASETQTQTSPSEN